MSKQKQRQKQGRRQAAAPKRPVPRRGGGVPRWVPAAAVLGLVAVAVLIFFVTRPGPPTPPPKTKDYAAELAGIQASELDQVGKGTANSSRFQHVSEAPLTDGGKPQVLYLGAEYCPFCGGERWALIIALSRFGAFSNLGAISSGEGNLPTFTFHGSSYTSSYVSFVAVETADRSGNPLESATAAQLALEKKYATGIPFIDFGNSLAFEGATFDVSTLQGMDWQGVVDALKQPGSPQAQGILGSANVITAALCKLTGQQPGAVCSGTVIQGLESQLPSG